MVVTPFNRVRLRGSWLYYTRAFARCQEGCEKMSIFSERLERLRNGRNIPQTTAAKDLGIGLRAYQYYENDEREPRLSVLVRMADYFGVSLDYLTGRTE